MKLDKEGNLNLNFELPSNYNYKTDFCNKFNSMNLLTKINGGLVCRRSINVSNIFCRKMS